MIKRFRNLGEPHLHRISIAAPGLNRKQLLFFVFYVVCRRRHFGGDVVGIQVPRVDTQRFVDFVPRFVETVDELPKNVIGRIRKDLLRNRGLGPGTWDRVKHGYIVSQ